MLSTLLVGLPSFLLAGGSTDSSGGIFGLLLPFVLIFGVFYFFIYRPQQKREQEHNAMVDDLQKGDQIVTIGGIHGTVRRVDDDSVLAQVDSNGVKLRIDKQAISSVGGKDSE
jgi:preprotein translocase subunit YajC